MAALVTEPARIIPLVDDLEVADFFDLRNQVLLAAVRTLVARNLPLEDIDVIAILDEVERIDLEQDKHCADSVNGYFVADLLADAAPYLNEKPVRFDDGDYYYADGTRLEYTEMVRLHEECDAFVRALDPHNRADWSSPRWWEVDATEVERRLVAELVRSDVRYLGSCRRARELGLDEMQSLNHIRAERGLKPLEPQREHKRVSIVRRPRHRRESRTRGKRRAVHLFPKHLSR
jgi:hypothetical protein